MSTCIFCKIISGEIPSSRIYEDEYTIAFRDVAPVAPTHILVVPKVHCESIHDIDDNDMFSLAALFGATKKIVADENLAESGYRLVINSGKQGGQAVPHLHLHILAGRTLAWPPG